MLYFKALFNVVSTTLAALLEPYIIFLLIVHIASGVLSLTFALTNGVYTVCTAPTKRQARVGLTHRVLWLLFLIAMALVGVTGLILSIIDMPPNYFLFSIALFALYLALTALRSLVSDRRMGVFDLLGAILMASISIVMVAYGIVQVVGGFSVAGSLVLFGAIGTLFALGDIGAALRRRPVDRSARFLARNFGTLIAALTAFLVVNVSLPGAAQVIVWVAPTILFSLMIRFVVRAGRCYAVNRQRRASGVGAWLALRIGGHIATLFSTP